METIFGARPLDGAEMTMRSMNEKGGVVVQVGD